MSEPKIRLALLWHMHQPYYKDLVSGIYRLPWTRLHGLKDYYGMVAVLEEFPHVHQTFNLVPSLLLQLEEYACGNAREPFQELAFKPADQLSAEDRLLILQYFFQANLEHLISRYPRYRLLYDRLQANEFAAERALPFFSNNDFTDLQVLSQLAWFDEFFLAGDAEIQALAAKGEGYTFADQKLLEAKERQVIGRIAEAYRSAAERGQIEISTSPFYHPILPLLCDTNIATEPHPGVRLPSRRFRHPEDARLELERAIELHRRMFGCAPQGVWPSEGSLSQEVLALCSSLGFRWIASDQQVLSNSIGASFYRDGRGALVNAGRLYIPYAFATPSGEMQMLFRDHELSDLIGFVYARMPAEEAAADFIGRIKRSVQPMVSQGNSPLVSIILDGENAWEYYPFNGRPFLRALYRMFSDDPQIECVTVSEALARHGPAERLQRLAAGSWINANFDIWIGAEEDNEAWDYLSEARDFFSEYQNTVPPARRDLALEELLIAEGSDWCWWYGPEHSTANDSDFDALYRSHLANVYHALGHRPPDALSQPIAILSQRVISTLPLGDISPCIDGSVTNYFEWMGAGFYAPLQQGAAMHGGRIPAMQEAHFGRDENNFFLRIDLSDRPADVSKIQLRLRVRSSGSHVFTISFSRPGPEQTIACEIRRDEETQPLTASWAQAAFEKIFEMRLSLGAMSVESGESLEFQITFWEDNYPRDTFPQEGWLAVPPPGRIAW